MCRRQPRRGGFRHSLGASPQPTRDTPSRAPGTRSPSAILGAGTAWREQEAGRGGEALPRSGWEMSGEGSQSFQPCFGSVPLAVRRNLPVFQTWKPARHEPPSLPLLTALLLAPTLRNAGSRGKEETGSVPWGSCCRGAHAAIPGAAGSASRHGRARLPAPSTGTVSPAQELPPPYSCSCCLLLSPSPNTKTLSPFHLRAVQTRAGRM